MRLSLSLIFLLLIHQCVIPIVNGDKSAIGDDLDDDFDDDEDNFEDLDDDIIHPSSDSPQPNSRESRPRPNANADTGDSSAHPTPDHHDQDGEDDSYDEDEFEGFMKEGKKPIPKKSTHKSTGNNPVPSEPTNPPSSNPNTNNMNMGTNPNLHHVNTAKESYWGEVFALIFIVVYAINFIIGKRKNEQVAQRWYNEFRSVFEMQFASISSLGSLAPAVNPLSANDNANASAGKQFDFKKEGLIKDSQSCFKFYASGRRYCTGLLATLELRKRHDLFSLLLALVDLSTVKDSLTIEIPMNNEDMDPFVFAIVRKKEEKRLRKSMKDLENFTGVVKSKLIPESLCILTDCPELEREFLDERVSRTLSKHEDLFCMLHLSDQTVSSIHNSQKVLKFKFNIPLLHEMDRLKLFIQMAIHFIDRVASKKLSAQARIRAEQKRKLAREKLYKATHSQRQEAFAKRKEELKKKEEENAPELTKEQQRRKEEREYKQSLKRKQPRVKMIR